MKEIFYYRFGEKFRKISRDTKIEKGAMQSWCGGELQPIMGTDIIGDIPASFSDERDFYNPV